MSAKIPGGKNYFYGLFYEDTQIGFLCYSNYVPHKQNKLIIYHFNRLVIHPDYQGFGLGLLFLNESTKILCKQYPDIRVMGKFSSLPVYNQLKKSEKWRLTQIHRRMGKMKHGGTMERNTGFSEAGIKTFHFEYMH